MIKQNPFSVYDFLGYLIPGSIVIYAYLVIDYLKNNDSFVTSDFVKTFTNVKYEGVFFFIIISYTIGHLISFASSVTIEKYANWRYSYPSKYLLNIEHKGYWKSCSSWKDKRWRIVMIIVLFPCVFLDWIFGKLLGFQRFYRKSLDHFLQDMIKSKVNRLLILLGLKKLENHHEYVDGKGSKYDFHRIITHYAYENSKHHQTKMNNYVALYGFLRTLSLIFSLLATYYFISIAFFHEFNLNNCIILFALSSLSYLSFMAFMKFYRRYTLEGLMIIVIDKDI